ncbi:porin [Cognatazoarcus halotolerans]|uniref:porin n=1 Tax=Cognatazoarcus halotolerans TaxID=2686016 RepID=UPI00135A9C2D|nr:porin [Cognatazoarcus halotolerans]
MKRSTIAKLVSLAFVSAAGSAQAVSFTQGDATLDINGTINGFYSFRSVNDNGAKTDNSALTNGLLPGWINFVFTTKTEGMDIKAHVGLAPGINDSSTVVGLPTAPGAGSTAGSTSPFSQIDVRNLYFQFGNDSMGTVKFGRDIGLFAQKIILSDMTLLGLGGATNASIPFNTTFGMIGHGYMYTGFQPQITYTTPDMNGFSASAGIFQPKDFIGSGETSTPGFQAIASYDWKGATPGSVWGGLVHQSTDGGVANTPTFNARGFELGAKVGFGNFEAVAYGFDGKGLGLSTVGAQFFSPFGETDSQGYFLQGTYKFGKTKVGLNYGENKDKSGTLTETNKSRGVTLGVYHTLNKYITLVGEYNQEKKSGADLYGDSFKARTISLGGVIFF